MSNDIAECGCEGHLSNLLDCLYPTAKNQIKELEAKVKELEEELKKRLRCPGCGYLATRCWSCESTLYPYIPHPTPKDSK